MAAGGVDEKSLGDLDRGLAKKLEFKCSIPRAKLKNLNIGPATNNEKASNEQTTWVTLASPPVTWSMNSSKPSNVAVVTPINAEEGPPLGCRGDSDVRQPTTGGKGTPQQGSSNDHRQGVLDESTPRYGRERSVAWHREASRKRSPSPSREDLRRRLKDPGRDRRWPIGGGVGHVEL
jgi:hypothetical protein